MAREPRQEFSTFCRSRRFPVLLRLHLILAWRPVRGAKAAEIAAVALLFATLALVSFSLAFSGFRMGSRMSESPEDFGALMPVAGGLLFLVFALMGLFHEGAGGGIDLSLLFHMPVSPREMILPALAARFLSPWFVPPLAFFLGCSAGGLHGGRGLQAAGVLPAILLWGIQVFLLLMAADFLLYHLRRSRRLAEVVGVLVMGAFLAAVFAQVFLAGRAAGETAGGRLAEGLVDSWGRWAALAGLLPGFSPFAWLAGGWSSPVYLAVALGWCALFGGSAAALLQRLMERGTAETGGRARRALSPARPQGPGLLARLPLWPFLQKDLRYYLRDPYLKSLMLGILVGPLILLVLLVGPGGSIGEGLLHFGMPYLLLMYFSQLSNNNLAMDRSGLTGALLSPFPRWRLLAGKNLALLALYLAVMLIPAGLLAVRGAGWPAILADFVMALSLGLLYFGAGNFSSLLVPVPLAPAGRRLKAQVTAGRMFLMSLFHGVLLGAVSAFALPVFLGRYAVSRLSEPAWLPALLCGVMLLYALLIYALLLAAASKLMPSREPGVYDALTRGGG